MKFFTVLLLLLPASPAFAQDCSLSGRIADPMGYVLPGAAIVARTADGVAANVTSDASGRFCLRDLSPADYEVSVTLPGFERTSREIAFSGSSAALEFLLEVAHVANGVTVTAMRGDGRDSLEVSQVTSIVTREDILRRPSRILPDVLREEAGVHVQQTTVGQGVAYLRGLMGSRVLVLIDGVRFNQSTFRVGPLQYMGTIDPSMVERVEIVKGPGSVLYGSDAMGGVINIIRKDRYYTPELQTHGRLLTQFGTADLSTFGRAENSVTGPNFVFSISGTFQKFNNLRAGGGRYSRSAESRFVTNDLNGTKGRQAPTGYEQFGVDASLRLRFKSDQELSFVFQRFQQPDVPRFDQLAGGNGSLRYQFDPQQRDFFFADWQKTRFGFIDSLRANVSFQSQPEMRKIQSLTNGRPGNVVRDWSDTNTFGFMTQAVSQAGPRHAISFGGEGYIDAVDSEVQTTEIATGRVTSARGRFPRNSRYRSFGAYAQDDIRIHRRLHLIAGGRASLFQAKAPDIGAGALLAVLGAESASSGIPTTLDYSTGDLTGNAGLVWTAAPGLNLAFNVGRAFRAPNINDFGGTGNTGVRFEIPSADLKPESLIGYEFSTKYNFRRSFFSLSLFDSEIRDLIDRRPGSINGQTIVAGAEVLTRTNFGRARILGYEAAATVRFADNLVWGNISHSAGRNISNGDYMGFEAGMPPTQGWVGYKWEPLDKRYWFEVYSQITAKQDRIQGVPLSMGGRFNGRATGEAADARIGAYRTRAQIVSYRQYHGIPLTGGVMANGLRVVPVETIADTLMFRQVDGFATMNLRGGLRLSERSNLHLMLENLFDRNYRAVGSGIDAPGINLRIGYEFRF